MTDTIRPKPGQVWRRKKDGQETTILYVPRPAIWNARIHHRSQRSTHTLARDFIKRYEYVRTENEGVVL